MVKIFLWKVLSFAFENIIEQGDIGKWLPNKLKYSSRSMYKLVEVFSWVEVMVEN